MIKTTPFIKETWAKLAPFWGMFYFAALLLLTHFAWKYSFSESLRMGGEAQVWLWQTFDCTAFFNKIADIQCQFIDWMFKDVFGIDGYTLRGHRFYNVLPERSVVGIVWSCSGMKQLFIFTVMLLFYPYGHKHKLWAIPVFGLIMWLLNMVRLMVLLYHTQQVPADFELWHEGSKYVFYAIMFGCWVFWEDIVKKYASCS